MLLLSKTAYKPNLFTSLIVQIKPLLLLPMILIEFFFTSLIVQIKQRIPHAKNKSRSSFTSLIVQIKQEKTKPIDADFTALHPS